MLYLYIKYLEHRLILKTMAVSYSFSTLWITVNLSDLRYLLVLLLANISLSTAINQMAFRKMQHNTVTMNLITVSQFFYITGITIINYLLVFGKQDSFLGSIFHYYSVMVTNGRSMLYLHYIL